MSVSKIESMKRERLKHTNVGKKKKQIPYGIIFIIIALIVYGLLKIKSPIHSIFWFVGLLFGFTLQRSRFCFTASVRDPILVGSTTILKALIISFIISTIGFSVIQYKALLGGNIDVLTIPGQLKPMGFHTAIGGVLFGIGMVIAGSCASGTLMRIGEGFKLQLIVLVGFIIGSLLGARHFEFWDKTFISKSRIIYLPEVLGFKTSVILQLLVLIILYFIADWYDRKNSIMAM